jgi:hypothetical protein
VADASCLPKEHTAMPGEDNLATLLRNMNPEMQEGIFVFCSIQDDDEILATLKPLLIFREREAASVIVRIFDRLRTQPLLEHLNGFLEQQTGCGMLDTTRKQCKSAREIVRAGDPFPRSSICARGSRSTQ